MQGDIKAKQVEAQLELEKQHRKEEDELMQQIWVNTHVEVKVIIPLVTTSPPTIYHAFVGKERGHISLNGCYKHDNK